MTIAPRIFIKARKARPFFGRHPWVFDGAIDRIEGEPAPGDLVQVHSFEKEFIAYGLFNPKSRLRVRLYSWDKDRPIDEALVAERLRKAVAFRTDFLGFRGEQDACRLFFSESDGLSGLVVDRYAHILVVQFHSLALARFEPAIVAELERLLKPHGIYRRTERGIGELEGLETEDGLLSGSSPDGPVLIRENGLEFWVDPCAGQKTGAFLDQRNNRVAASRYARGRSVLDVCCHGAGFGITALKIGGAASAVGIDVSGSAIALAQRNAEQNGVSMEFIAEKAVPAMEQLRREKRRFGMVVCDPPKFARTPGAFEAALRGYEHLNRLAMDLLEPDGILVTCSCSGHVSREAFTDLLATAAQKNECHLQILEQRGQAPDHPVALFCRETEYLKCLVLRRIP